MIDPPILRIAARRCAAITVLSAALCSGWLIPEASAAVRVCKPPVSSGLASDTTEIASRKKALTAWTANAKAAGSANPNWRIAANKLLKCARVATGQFDCVARAEPCSISQTAPNLPRRGVKTKEKAISI